MFWRLKDDLRFISFELQPAEKCLDATLQRYWSDHIWKGTVKPSRSRHGGSVWCFRIKREAKNLQRIHKLVSRVGEVAPEGMGEGGEAKFLSFFLTIAWRYPLQVIIDIS